MLFKFEHRPYGGRTFRPRPEIHVDSESGILLVATPWGHRDPAKKVIDHILDYFVIAKGDKEVTSPFERLSCLSSGANNLRIAVLLANEMLYREDNTSEYKSGVELFSATVSGNELIWLQVGMPQVLLCRKGRPPMPLGTNTDLAYDLGENSRPLAPLPGNLLGLDNSLNLTLNSFRIHSGDRILLVSNSYLPTTLFLEELTRSKLDSISEDIARFNPDTAFWIGALDFDEF